MTDITAKLADALWQILDDLDALAPARPCTQAIEEAQEALTAYTASQGTPDEETVERVARAIYLAMHASKGGVWDYVETKDVWRGYARAGIDAMPAASLVVTPNEPGGFVGDMFYGNPAITTEGTHWWTGTEWERLPSDVELLTKMLAAAREERDAACTALSALPARDDALDALRDSAIGLCAAIDNLWNHPDLVRVRSEIPESIKLNISRHQMQVRAKLAAPAQRDDGWMPIETAPKDGTQIFVTYRAPNGKQTFRIVRWYLHCWASIPGDHRSEPTHWRPLSAPPAPAQEPRS